MALDSQSALDTINLAILDELQKDARLSHSELARRVRLSAPAVSERVRRLEEAGFIAAYSARVPAKALGYSVTAIVCVVVPPNRYKPMYELARDLPEIRECYHVAGETSLILKVLATSIEGLEQTLQKIQVLGTTQTSIVMSAPVVKETFDLWQTR